MKIARCPVCHSDLHLDALMEDDAGRELLALILPLPGSCARHLIAYIGLFRPEKSNLSNARALKLAREVLDLYPPGRVLAHALSETVERLRAKRNAGDKKPLTHHAYLATVYSTSKELFAKTSTVDARERQQGERPSPGRDSEDAYFENFQRMGIDLNKVHGGPAWLAKKEREKEKRDE